MLGQDVNLLQHWQPGAWSSTGRFPKLNEELQGTQERIAFFCRLVAHMRQVESLANFRYMASGYLAEIEKMHVEVMAYLSRHASELRARRSGLSAACVLTSPVA